MWNFVWQDIDSSLQTNDSMLVDSSRDSTQPSHDSDSTQPSQKIYTTLTRQK